MNGHTLRRPWLPALCGAAIVLALAATAAAKTIVGTARADVLRGTQAADTLDGRGGNDRLYGYGGADRLLGGSGNDRLYAGAGRDVVSCGAGRDIAVVDLRDRVSRCEDVRRPSPQSNVLRAGPLAPGEYVSAASQPRVRLTVGSGWQVLGRPKGQEFTITRAFTDWLAVSPWPAGPVGDVVAQLSTLGRVTAEAAPVTVGGKPGQRFDLVGPTTVGPFPGSFRLEATDSARVWVLDRGPRTLTIIAKAPTAEFRAYVDLAQQVLGTFAFEP